MFFMHGGSHGYLGICLHGFFRGISGPLIATQGVAEQLLEHPSVELWFADCSCAT